MRGCQVKKEKEKKRKKPTILCCFSFSVFHSTDLFSLVLHSYLEIMNCVRIGILDAAIEIAFLASQRTYRQPAYHSGLQPGRSENPSHC